MKKIVFTLVYLSSLCLVYSQQSSKNFETFSTNEKSTTPKADKFFDFMWYKKSAELYEYKFNKLSKKSSKGNDYVRILERAGDAYFFNTDMQNASRMYSKLVPFYYDQINPEYILRYAHSLEGINKYKEAKFWMKKFSNKTGSNDDRSQGYSQRNQTIEDILNIIPRFRLRNLSVNTSKSDFGTAYYKKNLVFASATDSSFIHKNVYQWNKQPFLNLYVSKLNTSETDVDGKISFSDEINTKYHEATLSFSADYKRVYFTRNNYEGSLKRGEKGINHLKLYSADLKDGENGKEIWTNIKELPFNSDNYSVGHPSVSKDGKLLYFVSDMPGSIGATDIFVVEILEGHKYSQPKNLGNKVNTMGREMFPFVTDNALYFSSDGHLGLGGLDVFESVVQDGAFSNPINLGKPLNSKLDDFAFIIKESENKGFVSSNREFGKGDDDIYSFERFENREPKKNKPALKDPLLPCVQRIDGFISNMITGERISEANVFLLNESGKQIEKGTTGINGEYAFKTVLTCDEKYSVEVSKNGYTKRQKLAQTGKTSGLTTVPLGLQTVNKLIVEENGILKIKIDKIYFDLDKSFIRPDAARELNRIVLILNQYPKMVIKIESHTDSRNTDQYNASLSDRRVKSTRNYIVSQGIGSGRIESAIGYGESRLINRCNNGVKCSKLEHQLNRRSEFIIIKM